MYARPANGNFSPGSLDFATLTLEDEVFPLLKKQRGFRDEVSFFNKDVKEGHAISFRDDKSGFEFEPDKEEEDYE